MYTKLITRHVIWYTIHEFSAVAAAFSGDLEFESCPDELTKSGAALLTVAVNKVRCLIKSSGDSVFNF